jgi:cytochrome c
MPLYPKIAGQNAEYAFHQMRDIRDGRRTNSMSAAMRATVTQVKDAEFQAMAEWLSRL